MKNKLTGHTYEIRKEKTLGFIMNEIDCKCQNINYYI